MQSVIKRSKFETMGQFILICFNEKEVLPVEEGGCLHYQYDSAKVHQLAKRCDVIQAVIRIKYPDLDSEFAARINGGIEQEGHEAWRVTAKQIADEFEEYLNGNLQA